MGYHLQVLQVDVVRRCSLLIVCCRPGCATTDSTAWFYFRTEERIKCKVESEYPEII